MRIHDTRLEDRRAIAAGTMAFDLEKPAGFIFKPGQAIDVVLVNPPDSASDSSRHTFSIASAPFEHRLTVATRMRDSAFKRTLNSLPIGAPILFEGPSGSLTLHNNRSRPAVMIAGGIGITPFISILRQAAHDQLPQQLVLLYANHRPEDAAFLADLQVLAEQNKRFRLRATMTRMSQSTQPWAGRNGPIDETLVHEVSDELVAPVYYLAGPPAMVASLRQTLNQAGIDDDDMRSEEFFGY